MGTGRRIGQRRRDGAIPARHAVRAILGKWKETAEDASENEIKPIDWLVPVS